MKQILVVDDEKQNRQMIERYLNRNGYGVRTAASGDEAMGQMAAEAFDLVITDIDMPGGVSGNDLARSLRESGDTPFPIIAMSGRFDSVAPGLFDFFLYKPFSLQSLGDLIPRLIQPRRTI